MNLSRTMNSIYGPSLIVVTPSLKMATGKETRLQGCEISLARRPGLVDYPAGLEKLLQNFFIDSLYIYFGQVKGNCHLTPLYNVFVIISKQSKCFGSESFA